MESQGIFQIRPRCFLSHQPPYAELPRLFGVFGPRVLERHMDKRLLFPHEAEKLLREDRSLQDVADSVGYANVSTFTKAFKRRYGATPTEWGRQNR